MRERERADILKESERKRKGEHMGDDNGINYSSKNLSSNTHAYTFRLCLYIAIVSQSLNLSLV